AARLMRFAKESGTAVFVVGHVTKGGSIAGPKTLEHIADTVLYFEGESSLDYRLLRATKNRFGSVDELGVFSMTERGLAAVPNPSAVFLAARSEGTSGSAVTALMEGTRPVLVEVQALAAPSGYGTPQRVATGLDPKRLAVLLAVLERRGGASFAQLDVFVQVTAGVRLREPGADLAVAAALLSSLHNTPTPADSLYLGEIGLGGEVRPIGGLERRLAEAGRTAGRAAPRRGGRRDQDGLGRGRPPRAARGVPYRAGARRRPPFPRAGGHRRGDRPGAAGGGRHRGDPGRRHAQGSGAGCRRRCAGPLHGAARGALAGPDAAGVSPGAPGNCLCIGPRRGAERHRRGRPGGAGRRRGGPGGRLAHQSQGDEPRRSPPRRGDRRDPTMILPL